jgi:hypothetical protein
MSNKGGKMQISVYQTKGRDSAEVVEKIRQQYDSQKPRVVIVFSSSRYEPEPLIAGLGKVFPGADVVGCSTAGEIISGQMLTDSVVVMALGKDIAADAAVGIIENVSGKMAVAQAFGNIESHFNMPLNMLDIEKYVGIILTDGLCMAEERLMERIGDLTDLMFIGGSAGDDFKFEKTWVYANGKVYTDASVLLVLHVPAGFDILKTQSVCTMNKILKATCVNESEREVIAFDHKPAALKYAELLGVKVEEIADCFMSNPLGLMVDNEPYIRSPFRLKDNDIVFSCNIKEGMELTLLQTGDIVADTKAALDAKCKLLGNIRGIINFHCILRTHELTRKNQTDAYGALFKDIPTIGFSTYGEAYIGHMNQTSTMLLFR